MRPSITVTSFASLAALFALAVAGCKYSTLGSPLPGPGGPPTFKPGVVSEEKIPTAAATPLGVTTGPDGNLWFTEFAGNKVAKVIPGTFPAAGSIVECGPLPTAQSGPIDITSDPSTPNKVWFDEFANNKIASVDTGTCAYSEFSVPTSNAEPAGLTSDQSGVLWFAESAAGIGKIGKMTIGGSFTEYVTGGQPLVVTIAGDNTVWFLDAANNSVGHLTFPGAVVTEYGIPTNPADPAYMTLGPDGNLWFTELGIGSGTGCQVARITTGGSPTITEFQMQFLQPSPDGDVCLGITSAGGNLWFAEADTGAIGRVTTGGVVTEWGVPGNGTTAVFVANGPDSNLWFTDGGFDPNVLIGTNQVGRINLSSVTTLPALRVFKAKMSTHRLPLLDQHGVIIRRFNGRPINR